MASAVGVPISCGSNNPSRSSPSITPASLNESSPSPTPDVSTAGQAPLMSSSWTPSVKGRSCLVSSGGDV